MNTTVIHRLLIHVLAIIVLLVPVGCGGGGDASAPATEAVTTYYASGRIEASGQVLAGTAIKTGPWVVHHDVAGSPEKWRGSYRENAIDAAKPWIERNEDGSTRYAAGDR